MKKIEEDPNLETMKNMIVALIGEATYFTKAGLNTQQIGTVISVFVASFFRQFSPEEIAHNFAVFLQGIDQTVSIKEAILKFLESRNDHSGNTQQSSPLERVPNKRKRSVQSKGKRKKLH